MVRFLLSPFPSHPARLAAGAELETHFDAHAPPPTSRATPQRRRVAEPVNPVCSLAPVAHSCIVDIMRVPYDDAILMYEDVVDLNLEPEPS